MPLFLATSALSLLLSLAAKWLADAYLTARVPVIGEIAGLQPSMNPGIAFGIRLPAGFQEAFIIAALVFVCWLAWKSATTTVSRTGYGMIVGGALGNVLDRLPDGYVTDFFQVGSFPIFNVADSFITVGVIFLLAEMIALNRGIRR